MFSPISGTPPEWRKIFFAIYINHHIKLVFQITSAKFLPLNNLAETNYIDVSFVFLFYQTKIIKISILYISFKYKCSKV